MTKLQEILEHRTARSAILLRELLGPIRLEPIPVNIGRPYYWAVTSIDALALIEAPLGEVPAQGASPPGVGLPKGEPPFGDSAEGGSNSLRK